MKSATLIACVAAAVLFAASPLDAQKKSAKQAPIDFSAMTCQAFLQDLQSASEEDAAAVLLWLDGYLSGLTGDTVLRFDGLEQFATKLGERCAQRGGERLLDAARRVGIE